MEFSRPENKGHREVNNSKIKFWLWLWANYLTTLSPISCTRGKSYLFLGGQWWLEDVIHKSESQLVLSDSLWPHGLYSPWNFPGQNTGVGSLSLLQEIFLTEGSNLGLLHCRQILYQLSHKGSPRILDWVTYPFSSGSSRPRNQTGVSFIAGGFFTSWATREAPDWLSNSHVNQTCRTILLKELASAYPAKFLIQYIWN